MIIVLHINYVQKNPNEEEWNSLCGLEDDKYNNLNFDDICGIEDNNIVNRLCNNNNNNLIIIII